LCACIPIGVGGLWPRLRGRTHVFRGTCLIRPKVGCPGASSRGRPLRAHRGSAVTMPRSRETSALSRARLRTGALEAKVDWIRIGTGHSRLESPTWTSTSCRTSSNGVVRMRFGSSPRRRGSVGVGGRHGSWSSPCRSSFESRRCGATGPYAFSSWPVARRSWSSSARPCATGSLRRQPRGETEQPRRLPTTARPTSRRSVATPGSGLAPSRRSPALPRRATPPRTTPRSTPMRSAA
jgi:hypothetical protein